MKINELKDIEKVNKLWHLFNYCFIDESGEFILRGYSLIKAVENFVRQHPDIKIIQACDMGATSSLIVLIPHSNKIDREGISIISIPQNVGDPSVLYLDNSEILDMIKILSL